jgi:hypothetical protein
VTDALAAAGANITDLETRLAGSAEAPLYVMLVELDLGDASPEQLEAELRAVGGAEIEVSLRELEAEAL